MSEDDERAESLALLRELAADEALGLSPAAAGFLRDYLAREAAKSAVTTHDASEVAGNGLKVFCPRCGRELKDSGCSISWGGSTGGWTIPECAPCARGRRR